MSDSPNTPPPRNQPPPPELSIGARPRPVTRLSRRALVAGSAFGTALVFAALWYALGLHSLRLSGGPELYNTDAKPTDAIANMRGTDRVPARGVGAALLGRDELRVRLPGLASWRGDDR